MSLKLVDTLDEAIEAIHILESASILAIDCEGDQLSRYGRLTLLTICPYKSTIPEQRASTAYLFDILKLGQPCFKNGLKALLESWTVLKLAYDCGQDSNALYHQYQVCLTNVIDCQVFDQACRVWKGESMVHSRGWKTYLPRMSVACSRYFSSLEMKELDVERRSPWQ